MEFVLRGDVWMANIKMVRASADGVYVVLMDYDDKATVYKWNSDGLYSHYSDFYVQTFFDVVLREESVLVLCFKEVLEYSLDGVLKRCIRDQILSLYRGIGFVSCDDPTVVVILTMTRRLLWFKYDSFSLDDISHEFWTGIGGGYLSKNLFVAADTIYDRVVIFDAKKGHCIGNFVSDIQKPLRVYSVNDWVIVTQLCGITLYDKYGGFIDHMYSEKLSGNLTYSPGKNKVFGSNRSFFGEIKIWNISVRAAFIKFCVD